MSQSDLAAIADLARRYYLGMVEGDEALLRGAFTPQARFQGMRDGQEVQRGLDEFVAMTKASAVPADPGGLDYEVVAIDLSGPVAVLKLSDLYLGRRYTDYLTLIRGADGWRIANKAFHAMETGHGRLED
ncbi:MAG: nuclear transport factor 2 family protein [Caulobacteraceae bacterium]|nr:nuclear transport factor 2 family protein [Caulobacteraceae bacterium]